MPWKETCKVNERMRFIVAWSKEEMSFSGLCRAFGISRKTGYKWLERYELEGPGGLVDKPPIARRHPHKIDEERLDKIIRARKMHPDWGPRKLKAWLEEMHLGTTYPAASTIGDILKRYGLIRPRKRRLRVPLHTGPLIPYGGPNDVWCADFKGDFQMGDRTRCHPLTVMDGCTRYLLKCEGLKNQKTEPVREQFELAFREYGLPKRIRTDNGAPFASKALGGLSKLSVWWIRLGIVPERIEPGHPEQNGRHERMHKTLKAKTAKPPERDMRAQQRAFDLFRTEYNEERPHEALGQVPPSRRYALSVREYDGTERSPEYDMDWRVRRVNLSGAAKWKGEWLRLGAVFNGEPIGFKQTDEDRWDAYYGHVLLGEIDMRQEHPKIKRKSVSNGARTPTAMPVSK